MALTVHPPGRDHARRLVDSHHYVKESDWSDAQPTPDEENAYIDAHGWDAFGSWHLAVDPDESEETKARYKYPFGDFTRLHRSALIAAKQRAGEWDHGAVQQAADALLADVPEPDAD